VGVAALVAALLTVDLLAFKRVGTASDVGRYAAAAAIAHVPFFLLRSAPLVLMPAVAAAAAASHSSGHGLSEPVRAEIRRGVGDSVVLLALPTALLVVLGDRALETVFGASFGVSGLLVAPLTLATAAITLFSVLVAVETAIGTLRIALVTGTVGVTLVAVAATIGGEGSDVSRAAWAVAAAATFTLLIHSVSVWARAGSFVPARAVAALAVACAVAGVTLATPRGTPWLAGSALAACAIYGVVALRAGFVRLR
jgi:O-antigen/teichoic acid export membrane protein